jgi:hypothetical protein
MTWRALSISRYLALEALGEERTEGAGERGWRWQAEAGRERGSEHQGAAVALGCVDRGFGVGPACHALTGRPTTCHAPTGSRSHPPA